MDKPKPQDSFRLLLFELFCIEESFSKNKEEVTKPDSVCKVKFSLSQFIDPGLPMLEKACLIRLIKHFALLFKFDFLYRFRPL